MIKGFRDFIMRGNVVDLAVAVVIGAAFTLVINSFLEGLVNPLIAAVFGEPNLNSVGNFTINNAEFSIGMVLTAVINFLLIAAVIYFLVILPMNRVTELMRRGRSAEEESAKSDEVVLLTEIRDALRQQQK